LGAAERRNAILKALCRRRYETISNLATEFDVSERTIRRDIEILSFTEPIYTQSGRNGGVYVVDGYRMDRMYMSEEEAGLLCKIRDTEEAVLITLDD
jgi:predicted DNA-binding transcriptional regulator YafY